MKIEKYTAKDKASKQINLQSPDGNLIADFSLSEGGRLQQLSYKNQLIIADLEHKTYAESFASSILFPFANRIQHGNYSHNGKNYQLDCNENGAQNAIHGLVYNKEFKLVNQYQNQKESILILNFEDVNPPNGFPFPYSIQLTYTLQNTALYVAVQIVNKGTESFPFTIGWHPYFVNQNMAKTLLEFDSLKKILFNHEQITIGLAHSFAPKPFPLNTPYIDDCFVLYNPNIKLQTDNYKLNINGSSDTKYLQLYAPPNENRIAIEPMTGISDSFNHKKGLKTLAANQAYTETWKIKFNN